MVPEKVKLLTSQDTFGHTPLMYVLIRGVSGAAFQMGDWSKRLEAKEVRMPDSSKLFTVHELLTQKNASGKLPIHFASTSMEAELTCPKLRSSDDLLQSVQCSLKERHVESFVRLLTKHADLVPAIDAKAWLYWSVVDQLDLGMLSFLLEHHGALRETRGPDGMLPLHLLILKSNHEDRGAMLVRRWREKFPAEVDAAKLDLTETNKDSVDLGPLMSLYDRFPDFNEDESCKELPLERNGKGLSMKHVSLVFVSACRASNSMGQPVQALSDWDCEVSCKGHSTPQK